MKKQDTIVFLDGMLIPVKTSFLKSFSPGVFQERGVFETMRSYGGAVFQLEQHTARLKKGLKSLNIRFPLTRATLYDAIQKTLSANKLSDARIRLMVWTNHNRPLVVITASALDRLQMTKAQKKGYKIVFSRIKHQERAGSPRRKDISYSPYWRVRKSVREKADEGILLNNDGIVVEGSRTNIFFVKGDVLYTPSLKLKCLAGITRGVVISIARELGLRVCSVRMKRKDISCCDEIFVTNSVAEVVPVVYIGPQKVGAGKPGPVTKKIIEAYVARVSADKTEMFQNG